ncbi:hypothetical protein AJ79_00836 [Helicocarpus griseus UAMH5409]|uniref:Uncharacterized protein n=1 Tax=Helicocarpus griseus UAMH5409 TaxID=1447875 RepID=A0A2B7YBF8_9EURO|nr:hypothetical protein AJ79_00836 [Helicocarpus griseus UAMH5409]
MDNVLSTTPIAEASLASLSDASQSHNNNTTTRPQSSRRSSIFHPTRLSSLSPPPRQPEKPFSAQNRRLQLRNAGFRGAFLPSRRISPPFSEWGSRSREFERLPDKEDSDTAGEFQTPDLQIPKRSQTRRSSILQEISNSTQRRHHQFRRPPATSLFHDLPSPDSSSDDLPIYSPSKCTGQLGPPIELGTFGYGDPDMTGNRKGSSASWKSPFSSIDRHKSKPNMADRNADVEVTRYIEHLEEQLAASLDRAESIDSSATNVQAAKFKALNAEYKILKQELLEWEAKFEARVKDELRTTIEKESELRAKIRSLERDIQIKDNKIREQDWEIEMATQKLQNVDAVNSTNRSLERRVDVLTELLAQSPTRTESSPGLDRVPEVSSPQEDGVYRTPRPRPRSMFSKIPLSPVRKSLFQPLSVPESNPSLDLSVQADRQDEPAYILSPKRNEYADDAELMSLDSGLGDSCSPPSTRAPESQRSSMLSQASSSSSFWGTSFPLSPEGHGRISSRHRRMRRFPPGSCSLKPLILPATSPHVPAGHAHSHSFSGDPISPLRLRPSRDHESSSSSWMEPDTLSALEGRSGQYQSFDEAINDHRISMGLSPLEADSNDYSAAASSRVFFDDVHPSTQMEPPSYDIGSQNEPSKRMPLDMSKQSIRTSSYTSSTRLGHQSNHTMNRDITPVATLNSRIARLRKIYPATCSSVPLVDGRWDALHYIWEAVPSALTLVRRIIANAWHANWKKLGKLSWWVLGLFLGGQPRSQWLRTKHRGPISFNDTAVKASNSIMDSTNIIEGRSASSHIQDTPTKNVTKLDTHDASALTYTPPNLYASDHPLSIPPEPPPNRSLEVWAKFSFALVLAIGLAVRDGPASLMDECLMRGHCVTDGTQISLTDDVIRPPPDNLHDMPPQPGPSEQPSGDCTTENGQKRTPTPIPTLRLDIPPG